MALSKIQNMIMKLSESQNVKKVLTDIQKLSNELQQKVQNLKTDEAILKYKDLVKKASQAEGELEKEVNKVIIKIKKSASDVRGDLMTYKKKALEKKNELEKILKAKKAAPQATAKTSAPKSKKKKAAKRAKKKSTSTAKKA